MQPRQTIVRKCSKISKSRLHDLLMVGWSRSIAKFGKGPFAEAIELTTAAIDKQLASSMPGFEHIVDVYGFDAQVLDDVAKALGVRIVPEDAVCDTDDLHVLLARALVKISEAMHPESPGGRTIVHSEYLDGEAVMRELHAASGRWLAACSDIRKPREVA